MIGNPPLSAANSLKIEFAIAALSLQTITVRDEGGSGGGGGG